MKVQGTSSLSNTHFVASDASNALTSTQECTTPQCMQFKSRDREKKEDYINAKQKSSAL